MQRAVFVVDKRRHDPPCRVCRGSDGGAELRCGGGRRARGGDRVRGALGLLCLASTAWAQTPRVAPQFAAHEIATGSSRRLSGRRRRRQPRRQAGSHRRREQSARAAVVREPDVDAPRDRRRIHRVDQRRRGGSRRRRHSGDRRRVRVLDAARSERAASSSILTHGADVTQPWTAREIDRVPSSHRLRWYTDRVGPALAHERAARRRDRAAAELRRCNADLCVSRAGVEARARDRTASAVSCTPSSRFARAFCGTCLLSAGFAGIHRYERTNGAWSRAVVARGNSAPRCRRADRATSPSVARPRRSHCSSLRSSRGMATSSWCIAARHR